MHPALKHILFKGVGDPTLLWDEDFTTQTYRYSGRRYAAVTDLPATTFTRATGGYGVTAAGLLVWFAAGALRATDAGLTVEPAATNYTRASGDMTNTSYWGSTGVTRTGGQSDPLGGTSGVSLLATAGTAARRVTQSATSTATETAGAVCTHSFFVKQGTAPYALVGQAGDTPWIWATLKWSDLTLSTQACTAALDPVIYAGGYRRITITYTRTATNQSWPTVGPALNTAATIGNGDHTPTWAGTETVVAFGAQGESGAVATSYTPTTTAAATRNADLLASADTVISPTIVAEFNVPLTGVSYANVWQHDDGTGANCAALYFNRLLGKLYLVVAVSGVNQALLDLGAATAGSTYKVAARIATNDFAASKGGAACVTDVSGSLPAVTTFRRGRGVAAGAEWGAGIHKIKRYSTLKTNAELQALSA